MADSISPPPTPVSGLEIDRPMGKTLGLVLLAILAFAFGAFVVWVKISQELYGLREGQRGVSLWLFTAGLIGLIGAPWGAAHLVRSFWVRNRLVLAHDRLQIVEQVGGKDVVLLQIPYANIAEVKYEVSETRDARVGIDLINLDDPGTYAGIEDFHATKETMGRHLLITWGYRGGPEEVAREIEQAIKRSSRPR